MKITRKALDCVNSLVENGLLEECNKEAASAIIQGYMIQYCKGLDEKITELEKLLDDGITNREEEV